MVLPVRIELTTSPLPRGCSTTELRQRRAANGCTRNRRECAILAIRAEVAQPSRMTGRDKSDRPNNPKVRGKARLAAALRENLKRRKAQARGRGETGSSGCDKKAHDSAGIGADKSSD